MITEYWYVLENECGIVMFVKIKTIGDIVEIPKAYARQGYRLLDCVTGEEMKKMGILK